MRTEWCKLMVTLSEGGEDESPLQEEGLPLSVTFNLAFAMKKMMNDRALVHHLATFETIGSATCICCDKAGTLTTNHMTIVRLCIYGNIKDVCSAQEAENFWSEASKRVFKMCLQSIFHNTSCEVVTNKDGKRGSPSTPTNAALLEFCLLLGGDFYAKCNEATFITVKPFNSLRKRMDVVLKLLGGKCHAHCKGASKIILSMCDKVLDSTG
eukprot:Gb_23747 [translate_table: standard]